MRIYYYCVNTLKDGEQVQVKSLINAVNKQDAIRTLIDEGIISKSGYEFLDLCAIKNCGSCYYRHKMCKRALPKNGSVCRHWRSGRCYSCKIANGSNEDLYDQYGCEAEFPGGCKKYFKRDWSRTLIVKWLKRIGVNLPLSIKQICE